MPRVAQPTTGTFNQYLSPMQEAEEPASPSWMETLKASGYLYNDIYASYDLLTKKNFRYAPTPQGFDWQQSLKDKGLWDQADHYLGAHSNEEIDYRTARITEENKARDTLSRAGWAGYAAMVGAGMVSPTTFIPLLKGASGLRSVLKSAVAIGAGQATQEAVLFANQQTRTGEEAAFSIGTGTILGGILGGAAHWMHPEDFTKAAHDMANGPGPLPIPETTFGKPGSVGAAATTAPLNDAGRFAGGKLLRPVNRAVARLSPIDRGIEQSHAPAFMKEGSPTLRMTTAAFGQGGRTLESNIKGVAAAPGGNIESLVKTWQIGLHETQRAVEEAYKAYVYGDKVPKLFPKTRAIVSGQLDKSIMSFQDFKSQVSFAQWRNYDPSFSPHVIAAAKAADKHMTEMYDEGVRVGIFTGEEKVVGDQRYLGHMWDLVKIKSNQERLITDLMRHYGSKLQTEFQSGLDKLNKHKAIDKTFLEDNARSESDIAQLISQHKESLEGLEATAPPEVETVADLRDRATMALAQAKELEGVISRAKGGEYVPLSQARRDLLAQHEELTRQARMHETAGGENLAKYREEHAALTRRLRGLSQAKVVMTKRFAGKLNKIYRAEELQANTMLRASKAAHKLLNFLDRGSSKEIEAALSDFKTKFGQTAEQFDKAEEKIVKLTEAQDEGDLPDVIARQDVRGEKMSDLAESIAALDEHDPVAFRAEIEDAIKWMQEERVAQMGRRTLRTERLREQAKKISPEEVAKKLDTYKAAAGAREGKFLESWRGRGADDIDLSKGIADFTDHLRGLAEDVVTKIKGSERRLAYSDIIMDKRGPELARMLDVPGEPFAYALETDIEKILTNYTRTLAADISVAQKFGSADMAGPIAKLTEEENAAIAKIETLLDKKGTPLSEEAKIKIRQETHAFFDDGRKDLYTLLERARGHRGIPKDPSAWSARAGKAALQINSLRYLGGVIFSQINDVSSPIMRYGLLNTFRDGYIPFLTNMKAFRRINKAEAMHANALIDAQLHSRMHSFNDMWEDSYRGTLAERGLTYMSNKMGQITLFDQWTQEAKIFATGLANARIMRSIEAVMTGKASTKNIAHAQEYLAKLNLDGPLIEQIWKEITSKEGGNVVDGIHTPNTESWNVADPNVRTAQRAYRAALAQEMDDTIMTPGMERPSWIDSGIPGKLIGQFRSFGASATQKILLAGLQEHDARFINGVMISLALGSISYYLSAMAAGGEVQARMEKALDEGNFAVFADEGIARMNATGWLSEAQRIAERIPVLQKYASFSGGRTSKRPGGGLMGESLGPTYDMLEKMAGVITGSAVALQGDPITQHTYHLLRQLLPLQNLFYIRRLLDAVGDGAYKTFNVPQRSPQ